MAYYGRRLTAAFYTGKKRKKYFKKKKDLIVPVEDVLK